MGRVWCWAPTSQHHQHGTLPTFSCWFRRLLQRLPSADDDSWRCTAQSSRQQTLLGARELREHFQVDAVHPGGVNLRNDNIALGDAVIILQSPLEPRLGEVLEEGAGRTHEVASGIDHGVDNDEW